MAINSFPPSGGGPIQIPDQLIDPVSKFRVSNPENLIDTDFEYGLQPTKWETVELINNTPSFFSKSGDTTIDGISSIITNAGTREIIVKTELDHGLAVGIPINVTGTKSITADGAYIINSIPDPQTFTYLCKDNQSETNSILDLYSSIITGEFFQGSQLRISDSDGIVTDAEGTSILTVTTNTTHGFGENTPFYFLNLNSTVAQEFQAANTASKSFDASNSATAQTFDGSNSLSSVSIDWSNSATFGGTTSTISATDQAADTITVTHQVGENFAGRPLGTALYYSVSATSGYFNTNPRGIVFLKTITGLGTSTSTFQVSLVPDGDAIDLTSNLTGTFQIANQARTFAGNNIDPLTQTVIDVEVGASFSFDGGNQGYPGEVQETPPNNTLTILSYDGLSINADGSSASDHYVGSMVRYASTGTAATGLTANTTYFITSFTDNTGANYTFSVAALPGGTPISIPAGSGSGTQTFTKIGVSLDKDIVHVKNSNFTEGDMLEYTFPTDGRFDVETEEEEKRFYFVDTAYDSHNYKLSEDVGFKPIEATGGLLLPQVNVQGRTWNVHRFNTVGTTNFVVSDAGKEGIVEYLIVGGGGGGGSDADVGGGGGGGGFRTGSISVTAQTYPVVVGAGGTRGSGVDFSGVGSGTNGGDGGNSSAFGIVALGGGGGGTRSQNGRPGGSGGGGGDAGGQGGAGTAGQGFNGGISPTINTNGGRDTGAGGGAGGPAIAPNIAGPGRFSLVGDSTFAAGGIGSQLFDTFASGAANTGNGGSGVRDGGSGVVFVRYPVTPPVDFIAPVATGGTVTRTISDGVLYQVHTFTNTGASNFVVTQPGNWNQFEYLVIGGGGGTGTYVGGGGGGGGFVERRNIALSEGTYTVTVGAGGSIGTNGQNSSIVRSGVLNVVALGGGHGGAYDSVPGNAGGSGGGAGAIGGGQRPAGGSPTQPGSASGGFGFRGGSMSTGSRSNSNTESRGGGGAGGQGDDGDPRNRSNGGPGRASNISGGVYYYSGGGGGGAHYPNDAGDTLGGGRGGIGGGGGGGSFNRSTSATQSAGVIFPGDGGQYSINPGGQGTAAEEGNGGNGGANTGGGAGGTGNSGIGNGGSGIVIIRYPIAPALEPDYISATGGHVSVITENNTIFAVHSFINGDSTQPFRVSSVSTVSGRNSVQYLIVGGGGGGGFQVGGGGGAGGLLSGSTTVTAQSYPIVVGNGGLGGLVTNVRSTNGGNSSAFGLTAFGGGGGSNHLASVSTALSGGSGGGGSGNSNTQNVPGGAGTAGQGFAGGTGLANNWSGGGGGGAGGVGGNATSTNSGTGGAGGPGVSSSITGTARFYAGGGGGSMNNQTGAQFFSLGGVGGGGRGLADNGVAVLGAGRFTGEDGQPNTGGGGGGVRDVYGTPFTNSIFYQRAGNGGSGIVIVRYPIGTIGNTGGIA
jgi:hypothetical protein